MWWYTCPRYFDARKERISDYSFSTPPQYHAQLGKIYAGPIESPFFLHVQISRSAFAFPPPPPNLKSHSHKVYHHHRYSVPDPNPNSQFPFLNLSLLPTHILACHKSNQMPQSNSMCASLVLVPLYVLLDEKVLQDEKYSPMK